MLKHRYKKGKKSPTYTHPYTYKTDTLHTHKRKKKKERIHTNTHTHKKIYTHSDTRVNTFNTLKITSRVTFDVIYIFHFEHKRKLKVCLFGFGINFRESNLH